MPATRCDPLRDRTAPSSSQSGDVGLRPQSPANGWHPFRMLCWRPAILTAKVQYKLQPFLDQLQAVGAALSARPSQFSNHMTTCEKKHHFVIEPLKSVGPIHFGMPKDEVSRAFTYVYRSFFKGQAPVRSDHCEVVGLIMHYDGDSRVNYIEVLKAQHAIVTLELFRHDVTNISIRDAVELMRLRTHRIERNSNGYDFPELGINIYNHVLESDREQVECFGVASHAL